jgi:YidC/Oxa1 family membrane protein insertase
MERRLLIAFALSFVVIMLSRALWEPTKPSLPKSAPPPAVEVSRNALKSPEEPVQPETVVPETRTESIEKTVIVETDLFRLVLSNKGGIVKSWILKHYKDSDGKPLDVLDVRKEDLFGAPFALRVDREEEITKQLSRALFVCTGPTQLDLNKPGAATQEVTFEFAEGRIRASKKISLTPGSYLVQVSSKVWINGQPRDHFLIWPGGFGDAAVEERTAVHQGLYRNGQKITRLKADKIEPEQEISGSFDFVGVEDQYFAALFLSGTADPMRRILLGRDERTLESGKKELLPRAGVWIEARDPQGLKVFVGPKDTGVLAKVVPNLIDVIDYGWFGVVAHPLFMALKWIFGYVRNYGVAIVILTILINFALFPLRYKSMVSAQKMQKVQPQMKAIQEKYKKLKPTDPKKQQMNAEVMALYKQHGVNPLGGCLPLLLQMPFFLAFYNLLSVSIELRQAPFLLWIKDLSIYDHTFVLPVLMTISMLVSQKMTPTPSADPVQAKMMLAMPLVFGFMLAFTSSGLVLYWFTSNLTGIAQQYFMNRYGPTAVGSGRKKSKDGKRKSS